MQQKYFIVSHISGDGTFWHELVKMNMIWYNEMSLLSQRDNIYMPDFHAHLRQDMCFQTLGPKFALHQLCSPIPLRLPMYKP